MFTYHLFSHTIPKQKNLPKEFSKIKVQIVLHDTQPLTLVRGMATPGSKESVPFDALTTLIGQKFAFSCEVKTIGKPSQHTLNKIMESHMNCSGKVIVIVIHYISVLRNCSCNTLHFFTK